MICHDAERDSEMSSTSERKASGFLVGGVNVIREGWELPTGNSTRHQSDSQSSEQLSSVTTTGTIGSSCFPMVDCDGGSGGQVPRSSWQRSNGAKESTSIVGKT